MTKSNWIDSINPLKIIHRPKTLRSQLIMSVWLGMGAILIPFNFYTVYRDREQAISAAQQRLYAEGTLAHSALTRWHQSIQNLLEVMAYTPSIRRMDQRETQIIFDSASTIFPDRAFRLWTRDGDLIASSGTRRLPGSRNHILARDYFQKSRQGKAAFDVVDSCLSGNACYVESVPVFAVGDNQLATPSPMPVAVLTSVIRLADTGRDSGVEIDAPRMEEIIDTRKNIARADHDTLSVQDNDFTGQEVMLISREGHVIFPSSKINDGVSILSTSEIANSNWGPFVRIGNQATGVGRLQEVESKQHSFFTYSRQIDPVWSVVAVIDKASAVSMVYQHTIASAIRQLVLLGLISLVIYFVCRNAAKPIQVAAAAVREFSFGNFDAEIALDRDDEIGNLYADINQTGESLRTLLNETLAHAVTDKQIQIATNIQKEFIIQSLPSTNMVELAADFDPAYEIGADWYDAISIGNMTYIVIADVCDKGIGSALFMSVFQSLLHYSITEEAREQNESEVEQVLKKALTQVNNYMAIKHGHSAMFATLFLGAYDYNCKRLAYILAGHEAPLIVRSKGMLEALEVCGPAVGIFPGANYNVKFASLSPGELLFTFTDGLIDARSPSGKAWGIKNVEAMLSVLEPAMTTAAEVLARATNQVNIHRADAEQFDDMTLLVMKVN